MHMIIICIFMMCCKCQFLCWILIRCHTLSKFSCLIHFDKNCSHILYSVWKKVKNTLQFVLLCVQHDDKTYLSFGHRKFRNRPLSSSSGCYRESSWYCCYSTVVVGRCNNVIKGISTPLHSLRKTVVFHVKYSMNVIVLIVSSNTSVCMDQLSF